MAQNLTRNKNLTFRVTQAEYDMVHKRMAQTKINNLRAYLLKMAIDGMVIHIEMESIQERNKLLRNISNNVNQIAVRANSTGNIYAADLDEIKARQAEIWQQQDEIMKKMNTIIGEVR
ncbi:conjugal transfer protein [Clostridia bacterium]|nr:conjugal transfer protein [Clostridia bacterium]